jgi:hypothetical protein
MPPGTMDSIFYYNHLRVKDNYYEYATRGAYRVYHHF